MTTINEKEWLRDDCINFFIRPQKVFNSQCQIPRTYHESLKRIFYAILGTQLHVNMWMYVLNQQTDIVLCIYHRLDGEQTWKNQSANVTNGISILNFRQIKRINTQITLFFRRSYLTAHSYALYFHRIVVCKISWFTNWTFYNSWGSRFPSRHPVHPYMRNEQVITSTTSAAMRPSRLRLRVQS